MEEISDVRQLVHALQTEQNPDAQIAILQKTEKLLLTEYLLCLDGHTIEPLWVEAYYYSEGRFEDENSHKNAMQKNRFGQFYFHRKGWGGFDICLSDGEYYLSFLIKAFLADGVLQTQTGIKALYPTTDARRRAEQKSVHWVRKERPRKIIYTNRVHMVKPSFRESYLGAYAAETIGKLTLAFPAGCRKQWQRSISALMQTEDMENAAELAERRNGSKIEKRYWDAAVRAWEESRKQVPCCIPFQSPQNEKGQMSE